MVTDKSPFTLACCKTFHVFWLKEKYKLFHQDHTILYYIPYSAMLTEQLQDVYSLLIVSDRWFVRVGFVDLKSVVEVESLR